MHPTGNGHPRRGRGRGVFYPQQRFHGNRKNTGEYPQRVSSAPPTIEEQRKANVAPIHIPYHHVNYYNYYNYYPPYQQPLQPPPTQENSTEFKLTPRPRKTITIVDPNTNKELTPQELKERNVTQDKNKDEKAQGQNEEQHKWEKKHEKELYEEKDTVKEDSSVNSPTTQLQEVTPKIPVSQESAPSGKNEEEKQTSTILQIEKENEKTSEEKNEEPSSQVRTEEPSSQIRTEEPSSQTRTEEPSSQTRTEEPSQTRTEEPSQTRTEEETKEPAEIASPIVTDQRKEDAEDTPVVEKESEEELNEEPSQQKDISKPTESTSPEEDTNHIDESENDQNEEEESAEESVKESEQVEQDDSTSQVKLSYPPNTFRPDTNDGEKIYPRDFLLQFEKLCTEKPNLLCNPPKEPKAPVFPEKKRSHPRSPQLSSGAHPQRGKHGQQRKHQKQPSTPKLPRNPNAYVPPTASRDKLTEEQKMLKRVKGLLNKLSQENFDSITDQIGSCFEVSVSSEVLQDIITMIFDKALIEPKFSAMYSDLCVRLSRKVVDKENSFRRLILNKCQEVFEKNYKEDGPTLDSEKLKTMTKEEREEEEFLHRKKILGNIKFIGELFKNNMLTKKIMKEVILQLLGGKQNSSEGHLEALCQLLTTIGSAIDTPDLKPFLDECFKRMQLLTKDKNLQARIRFLLRDVIDLREQKWISRAQLQKETGSPSVKSTPPQSRVQPKTYKQTPSPAYRHPEPKVKGEWETVGKSKKPFERSGSNEQQLRPQSKLTTKSNKEVLHNSTNRFEIPKKEKKLSSEEAEKKAEEILKEYYVTLDEDDAAECIKELEASEFHSNIVSQFLLEGLETKEKNQQAIVKLFERLSSKQVVKEEDFIKGFEEALGNLEDFVIDIPKVGSIISYFIGEAICDGVLPATFLAGALKPLVTVDNNSIQALTIALNIFKILKNNEQPVDKHYATSQLNLLDLMKSKDKKELEEKLKENDLEELICRV